MSEEVCVLWRNAHSDTILRDFGTGIRTNVKFQRKSGDAATFFGNTLVLMGILATLFDFSQIQLSLFAGDDSLLIDDDFNEDKNYLCGNLFNMESKFYFFTYSYFCSKFLLNIYNEWRFLTDPMKLLSKLGRKAVINFSHLEQYRISLNDLLKGYNDETIDDVLTYAI